jgi:hypothetical protein
MVQGSVASCGTIDELTRDKQGYEIELASHDPNVVEGAFREALPPGSSSGPGLERSGVRPSNGVVQLGTLPTGESVTLDRHMLRIGTVNPMVIQPILDALRARGGIIRSVRPVRPSLEDLFMEAVTDRVTGAVLAPGAAGPGRRAPTPTTPGAAS